MSFEPSAISATLSRLVIPSGGSAPWCGVQIEERGTRGLTAPAQANSVVYAISSPCLPPRPRATPPMTSKSSKASTPCGGGRRCTSAASIPAGCITCCGRSSTTASTSFSPGRRPTSKSRCTRTAARSPSHDNGRGIPVDTHKKIKSSALEVILTTLHSGGKFSNKSYARSGGLHGVGSSVVNALSSEMVATIHRDGHEWTQRYKRGKPTTPTSKRCSRSAGTAPRSSSGRTRRSSAKTNFNADTIRQHLEDISYIHGGLKITFVDEAKKETHRTICTRKGSRRISTS